MKGQISSVKGSLLPQFSKYALEISIRIFRDVQIGTFDFDNAALDLVFFEWSYSFPYARIRFPLYLRPI